MRSSTVMGLMVCASVAIVAAPPYGMAAESTAGKMEQKAKGATQDARAGISDSWLTAKTKIALYGDDRVKGGQVSVETVKGAVSLRGKVDSDDAKAAAGTVAQAVEGVKSVRNDLQVVPYARRGGRQDDDGKRGIKLPDQKPHRDGLRILQGEGHHEEKDDAEDNQRQH